MEMWKTWVCVVAIRDACWLGTEGNQPKDLYSWTHSRGCLFLQYCHIIRVDLFHIHEILEQDASLASTTDHDHCTVIRTMSAIRIPSQIELHPRMMQTLFRSIKVHVSRPNYQKIRVGIAMLHRKNSHDLPARGDHERKPSEEIPIRLPCSSRLAASTLPRI